MSEEFAQTTLAMPPIEELYMEPKRKTGKLALIIVLSVVGVLLVAAIASFFGARWYYQTRRIRVCSSRAQACPGKPVTSWKARCRTRSSRRKSSSPIPMESVRPQVWPIWV